jgi:acyl-coenzyme A synthetase/AMP-(fatty) acid ligase
MSLHPMQDYAETARNFVLAIPETFNFGHDVVDAQAARRDKPALIWCNAQGQERHFNFSDIRRISNQYANLLTRHGLKKGDRVIVMLPRIPEWQLAIVACMKIGAIPIPCIEMLTSKDVEFRVKDSGAIAAITTSTNIDKFSRCDALTIRVSIEETMAAQWLPLNLSEQESTDFSCAVLTSEEPALLYYTSGSSGHPKGVLHATRGIYTWRLSAAWWQTLVEDDIKWCTSDTGWAKAGTGILFGPWSRGSCVFFYDGKFDARERLQLLERYKISVFCAPATEFRHLVNENLAEVDLSVLRLSVSAGETVNPEIVHKWKALSGSELLDGYGQTETLMTVLNYPCLPVKPGSMGQPIPGTHFEILSDDNVILGPNQVGHLSMRLPNPQFMLGYWNNPKRTQESIRTIDDVDYWRTGDLSSRDEQGYLFYAGRSDDMISSAGYRIGPTEVENALIEHPAVTESAVVASPDAQRGEVVKAFVVLHPDYVPSEALVKTLQQHVQQHTAPYKYPRRIEFVASLPKNPSGKIMRRVLRDQEFNRSHGNST